MRMQKTAKRGRPPLDNPRDQLISVRVTVEERDALRAAAAEQGVSVSALVRLLPALIDSCNKPTEDKQ